MTGATATAVAIAVSVILGFALVGVLVLLISKHKALTSVTRERDQLWKMRGREVKAKEELEAKVKKEKDEEEEEARKRDREELEKFREASKGKKKRGGRGKKPKEEGDQCKVQSGFFLVVLILDLEGFCSNWTKEKLRKNHIWTLFLRNVCVWSGERGSGGIRRDKICMERRVVWRDSVGKKTKNRVGCLLLGFFNQFLVTLNCYHDIAVLNKLDFLNACI